MDKTYDPHSIEQRWYKQWEAQGYFAPQGGARSFCIMLPPPNVTGRLHMGHAFQSAIVDALIRYRRMRGDDTLWQPGTDHAGIATQMVVERQLNAQQVTRHDLGRDAFIDKVWEWKTQSGNAIVRQLRRIGASLDWSRERFTMDEGLSEAVKEVFVRLYEEGLIYRGKRLVNWDPVLHTAVSDVEVVNAAEQGHLWHMRYPLADGSGQLVVATTRPETLLGDAAVAVHPDDERFQHLIGQQVELPLTGRKIPIIADAHVDPEFGTGCVKVTPAHDFNDYDIWSRHRDTAELQALPNNGLLNIFTVDACVRATRPDACVRATRPDACVRTTRPDEGSADFDVLDLIPPAYRGLERYAARKQIVADLDAAGLLAKTEPHEHAVPRGDRSGAVIEPMLTDQWFVKIAPLAEPAIAAVESGAIRFVPESWQNTYFEWMRNIQDWCISRQIWWGHRIPAWYDDEGKVYVGRSEPEVRQQHGLADTVALQQDEDVLDTWFSSALWPFSTLGWPEATPELAKFYPTDVLVTGFDIIPFWVSRMIMMGLKFTGQAPFHTVYVHGLVRDRHGHKMSKSRGNVLDPLDMIDGIDLPGLVAKRTEGLMQPQHAEEIERHTREDFPTGIAAFGTDAVRFTFAILASTARNINFDLKRVEGYRNFCNKLWNAARYVLSNTEDQDCGLGDDPVELSAPDRWIRGRLQHTIEQVIQGIEQYRFDLAAQAVYDFTWNEYCDWYLELSKPVLNDEHSSAAALRGTRQTLVRVLETLLRLAHPIIPFITEEIWQRLAPLAGVQGKTIMLAPYPQASDQEIDAAATADMQWLMNFILGVRQIRSSMNIKPSRRIPVLLQHHTPEDLARVERYQAYLSFLARIETITPLAPEAAAPESATALVDELRVLIPMAGLIDVDAERQRLEKEIAKTDQDLQRVSVKLDNPNFVGKAPAAVVDKERARQQELHSALSSLREQLAQIQALGN